MITDYNEIINLLENINPIKYAKDRNFIDGSVSRISPYISRGIISTKQVYKFLIKKGYSLKNIQKFVQEMVWREFWQITWQNNNIDKDLKHIQKDVEFYGFPSIIINHNTQINAIDKSIKELYYSGYMHNHLRMYVASLCTNILNYHWKLPAKWMYYHLLDGDWGSNSLSWQWVCGANSNKKYYANQDNINRFTKSNQKNTILDTSYDEFLNIKCERKLTKKYSLELNVNYPKSDKFLNKIQKPICIYNYYNLDVNWRKSLDAHRILLIEPSIFKQYPISDIAMKFMIDLSKNIKNIKIFVGEFNELPINKSKVYFKEHPLNYNYIGTEDSREWIYKPKIVYKSFFKHWNTVIKQLYLNPL